MNKLGKHLFTVGTALTFALSLGLTNPQTASAQLDPSVKVGTKATVILSFGVYEDRVLVGEILREGTDPSHYIEHWVLFPDYVYPSERNGVTLEIKPGLAEYRDADDFFRRVPWSEGSRYVKTDCLDGTKLPIQR